MNKAFAEASKYTSLNLLDNVVRCHNILISDCHFITRITRTRGTVRKMECLVFLFKQDLNTFLGHKPYRAKDSIFLSF